MVNSTPYGISLGRQLRYPSNTKLGGPHSRRGRFGEEKNFLLLSGFKFPPFESLAYSLYQLPSADS
jgi:hypothetical protein